MNSYTHYFQHFQFILKCAQIKHIHTHKQRPFEQVSWNEPLNKHTSKGNLWTHSQCFQQVTNTINTHNQPSRTSWHSNKTNGLLITLPDPDSKPSGYIVLCRRCSHYRDSDPTLLLHSIESISVSDSGNVFSHCAGVNFTQCFSSKHKVSHSNQPKTTENLEKLFANIVFPNRNWTKRS